MIKIQNMFGRVVRTALTGMETERKKVMYESIRERVHGEKSEKV